MKDKHILDNIVSALEIWISEGEQDLENFEPRTLTFEELESWQEKLEGILNFIQKSRIKSCEKLKN